MKRKWDINDEVLNKKCIDEIITRIEEIGDSGPGVIAAQDIIDIVAEYLAPVIYNKGVNDAKKIIETKLDDTKFELDALLN